MNECGVSFGARGGGHEAGGVHRRCAHQRVEGAVGSPVDAIDGRRGRGRGIDDGGELSEKRARIDRAEGRHGDDAIAIDAGAGEGVQGGGDRRGCPRIRVGPVADPEKLIGGRQRAPAGSGERIGQRRHVHGVRRQHREATGPDADETVGGVDLERQQTAVTVLAHEHHGVGRRPGLE